MEGWTSAEMLREKHPHEVFRSFSELRVDRWCANMIEHGFFLTEPASWICANSVGLNMFDT